MKLCVMLEETEHHPAFKQEVEAPAVPEIGETFGVQPEWALMARGNRVVLYWVRSRRWYLEQDGELWVDVHLTEDPAPVLNTTIVDSCRRALHMGGL